MYRFHRQHSFWLPWLMAAAVFVQFMFVTLDAAVVDLHTDTDTHHLIADNSSAPASATNDHTTDCDSCSCCHCHGSHKLIVRNDLPFDLQTEPKMLSATQAFVLPAPLTSIYRPPIA